MKKILSLILSLVVTALVVFAPVNAMAAQPIEITSVRDNGNATFTITWNNPNGGDVTVASMVMDDGTAGNRIVAEFDVSGNEYTYRNLAPGLDYLLLVFPDVDLDNAGMEIVSVPEAEKFDDFFFNVDAVNLAYFVPKGNSYSYNYAKDLTNREIYDMLDDKQFWVKIDFNHVAYSSSRTFPLLTVVTSPTGYVATDYDEVEIGKNVTAFWQTMVYMNDALATMHDVNGEIPTGEYKVDVYMDGDFVGSSSFKIK